MTPEYIIKLAEQEKLKGNHSPTLREAAELALTAMEYGHFAVADQAPHAGVMAYLEATDKLRTALADQSEQALEMVEPIAYISGYVQGHPVIKTVDETVLLPVGTSFYTAPPQRKPLTDEEILLVLRNIDPETKRLPPGLKALIQEIEAAHGIGEKR